MTDLRQPHVDVVVYASLKALKSTTYYSADTHWNERGARSAAEAVSARLRALNLAPPRQGSFAISAAPVQERIGDLIRLAGLDTVPWPLRPRGDREAPSRVEQTAKREIGPFDDLPLPEIVVVGTSFSKRANFVPFLSLTLAAPVANMAKDGGGMVTAAAAYFANQAFTETPPRVIVWEIPERLLEEPLTPAEKRWAEELGSGKLGLKEETDTASRPE
jgi:alginate O-acetyltransferase complex protein AlgJ